MRIVLYVSLLIIGSSCNSSVKEVPKQMDVVSHEGDTSSRDDIIWDNILTSQEVAAGWVLLFDGKQIDQWHLFKNTDSMDGWKASDGTIYHNPQEGMGYDLVSNKAYEDFEFMLDWKIEDCGNSGIFWNVQENDGFDKTWQSAPEMQILDNKCHPDNKYPTHRAGDLYDMIETSIVNVKPAGQWNRIKIQSRDGVVDLWQNGVRVVSFTMHTPEWDKMVAKSKFKNMKNFGKARKGHIALQDHGNHVWFKNIKIRELQ